MAILLIHSSNVSRRQHFAHIRRYAADRGERFLLAMSDPGWETEFVDAFAHADTSDLAATVRAVAALAEAEPQPIRGVVTFSEHSVPAAAAVAAHLGLPFVDPSTAEIARDKYAMRQAFEGAGLEQPAFGIAATVDAALDRARRIGYPLVLKPFIGGGSSHIRRVDGPTELAEHFEALRDRAWHDLAYDPLHQVLLEKYQGACLLEEFVVGEEISVESVVADGHTHVVAIHDKPLPANGPYFEEYFYATPTCLPPETVARIRHATAAAHRAVGIDIGGTHTEFRIRPDGRLSILETAARIGGGPLFQSVLTSTGVDMIHAVLDLSLGRTPRLTPKAVSTPAGFCQFFAERAGKVRAVHGEAAAAAHPHVRELMIYPEPGDAVDVAPFIFQGYGHAFFTADTYEGLTGVFAMLQKTIRLELDQGDGHG
ncbi:ATP-grasp domain-containing protein [Embleya hyalina]|uniref:Carboxylase n=1 Tax=Embleya hyalina TaxID=516124 RepID=A0A401Z1U0_9ACTN|nr:ATP-grasp domain-containing protein [Embleya hyalina]GCE00798.1 carboxylase [Embleya hyalina]